MGFLRDYGVQLRVEHFCKPSVMLFTHIHPQYELYFCSEPIEQISVINGVEYRYKHAAVILSAPYTVHSMSCADDASNFDRYVFYFGENTVNAFDKRLLPSDSFGKNIGLLYELTVSEAEELSLIARMLDGCMSVEESELVFALFVNRLNCLCPPERVSRVGATAFYIQDVLRYTAENLNKKSDISDIARRFAVSRSKLDRDFKRFTGMTVHEYLDICRINQAKYLLHSDTKIALRDIAAACGFESESCFFHFFKRVTGNTPSDFRRKK